MEPVAVAPFVPDTPLFPGLRQCVEDEACRRILTDEARRLKLDGAVLTASDSIRVMQQISRQLDRTFPQAAMQRTTLIRDDAVLAK